MNDEPRWWELDRLIWRPLRLAILWTVTIEGFFLLVDLVTGWALP